MAISSEERSGAMKTVIEGEQLQLEMMQLLQITRPCSGRQEDYDNMVKVEFFALMCQAHCLTVLHNANPCDQQCVVWVPCSAWSSYSRYASCKVRNLHYKVLIPADKGNLLVL